MANDGRSSQPAESARLLVVDGYSHMTDWYTVFRGAQLADGRPVEVEVRPWPNISVTFDDNGTVAHLTPYNDRFALPCQNEDKMFMVDFCLNRSVLFTAKDTFLPQALGLVNVPCINPLPAELLLSHKPYMMHILRQTRSFFRREQNQAQMAARTATNKSTAPEQTAPEQKIDDPSGRDDDDDDGTEPVLLDGVPLPPAPYVQRMADGSFAQACQGAAGGSAVVRKPKGRGNLNRDPFPLLNVEYFSSIPDMVCHPPIPFVMKMGDYHAGIGKALVRSDANLADFRSLLSATAAPGSGRSMPLTAEPYIPNAYCEIRVQKVGERVRASVRYNMVGNMEAHMEKLSAENNNSYERINWKVNVAPGVRSAPLEPCPERYRRWINKAAELAGGLRICSMDLIMTEDRSSEYILEINGGASGLIQSAREADTELIRDMVLAEMSAAVCRPDAGAPQGFTPVSASPEASPLPVSQASTKKPAAHNQVLRPSPTVASERSVSAGRGLMSPLVILALLLTLLNCWATLNQKGLL